MAKAKKGSASSGSTTESLDPDEATILEYLTRQNRPYSATDVFNNLHGAVGKTGVTRALAALAERNVIHGKTYGKQSVYVARQDSMECPSALELAKMDEQIDRLKSALGEQNDRNARLAGELGALNAALTNEQLQKRIGELTGQIGGMEEKLSELQSGNRRVDPKEKERVDREWDSMGKAWKQRKRLVPLVMTLTLVHGHCAWDPGGSGCRKENSQ